MKEGEQVLLFLGDTTGFLKEIDGTLYGIIGDYDGKLYLQNDGTYKRPSPSETDEYVFEAGNLIADSIIDLSSGLNCLQSEVKLWNRKR